MYGLRRKACPTCFSGTQKRPMWRLAFIQHLCLWHLKFTCIALKTIISRAGLWCLNASLTYWLIESSPCKSTSTIPYSRNRLHSSFKKKKNLIFFFFYYSGLACSLGGILHFSSPKDNARMKARVKSACKEEKRGGHGGWGRGDNTERMERERPRGRERIERSDSVM